MMPPGDLRDGRGNESERRRATRTTPAVDAGQDFPEDTLEGEMDEIEDEDEDDSRSNDASSEGGDRDEPGLARPSTSGTRTNSTSSTTNDGVAGAGAVPQKTQAAFVNKSVKRCCLSSVLIRLSSKRTNLRLFDPDCGRTLSLPRWRADMPFEASVDASLF